MRFWFLQSVGPFCLRSGDAIYSSGSVSPRNFRFVSSTCFSSSISFTSNHFRTLLRCPNSQPPSFQSFPNSLLKTPGAGCIPGSRAFRNVKTFKRSLTPLECALTKTRLRKSFRMRSSEKRWGVGPVRESIPQRPPRPLRENSSSEAVNCKVSTVRLYGAIFEFRLSSFLLLSAFCFASHFPFSLFHFPPLHRLQWPPFDWHKVAMPACLRQAGHRRGGLS